MGREEGGWAVGEVFREQSGRKWGGVLRRKGKDIFVARNLNLWYAWHKCMFEEAL